MAQAVHALSITGRVAAIFNSAFFANPPAPVVDVNFNTRPLTWIEREELTFILRRCEVLQEQFSRASLTLMHDMISATVANPLNELRFSLAGEINEPLWRRIVDAAWEADECVRMLAERHGTDIDAEYGGDGEFRALAACNLTEIINFLAFVLANGR